MQTEEVKNAEKSMADNLEQQISKMKLLDRDPEHKTKLINFVIERVLESSSFYKQMAGLRKIKDLDDFKNIPFTTREDIKNNSPDGIRSAQMCDIVRYGQSNGTDGKYSSGYATGYDWIENSAILFFGFSQVYDQSDIIMIAAPYEMSLVAADFDRVSEMIGATTIAVSSNHTKEEWIRILGIMKTVHTTVFACAATRILRLGILAQEMGLDPRTDFNLKKVICVGELLSAKKKKVIENMWGCQVFITYGMTEANSVASPCENEKLHLCEGRYYFEIINPESGEEVSEGELGELVLTSYNNEAMPLIRYRTGDLVKTDNSKDDCCLSYRRIIHYGRVDDFYRIHSMKLYMFEIEEIMFGSSGLESVFQAELSGNELILRILPVDPSEFETLSKKIKMEFKNKFGIKPKLDLLNKEEFLKEIDDKTKPGSVYFRR